MGSGVIGAVWWCAQRSLRRIVCANGVCAVVLALVFLGCGSSIPRFAAKPNEDSPSVRTDPEFHQLEGVASYYADEFNGRPTASGEAYDMNSFTAAHRSLPFNTEVRVLDLDTGKSVIVRINDRGPFKDNRVIDVSLAAAKELGLVMPGTANVRLEILQLGLP
jgi:rare lipoprotein A